MGGMPYGLVGPTAQTTGRATFHLDVAAQTESLALTQCCPHDAGVPRPFNRRFPTTEGHDAFQLALSSGAAKKAVVTFGD